MQNATSRCTRRIALCLVVVGTGLSGAPARALPPVALTELVSSGLPAPTPQRGILSFDAVASGPPPLVHTVRSGDTLNRIAAHYRAQSGYYGQEDLLAAIRTANDLSSNLLRPGQQLLVPRCAPRAISQVTEPAAAGRNLRGIYLTGAQCGYSAVFDRIDAFIIAGGNGIVFDVKDIDGGVSFPSTQPLAVWGKGRSVPPIPSLPELMERLDSRGLYVVARIALFLDGELGRQRPDLALQDSLGRPWIERGCVWVDPAAPEVLAYNLGLAVELARAGVDEIQFDYVRYPTNGWRGDWQGDLPRTAQRRRSVITRFLQAARDALAPYDVAISTDLFGIMAWGRVEDLALTGQHVPTIASLVDVVCPMIYPSHFEPGFENYANPGDHPRYFIGEGVRRFAALVDGGTTIRPWLQAFAYRVRDYGSRYVADQIQAAEQAGAAGWCLWNPAGRYEVACAALTASPVVVADRPLPVTWLTGPLVGIVPPRPRGSDAVLAVADGVETGATDPGRFDLLLAAPPIALESELATLVPPVRLSAGAMPYPRLAAGPAPNAAWSAPPDRAELTGAAQVRGLLRPYRR